MGFQIRVPILKCYELPLFFYMKAKMPIYLKQNYIRFGIKQTYLHIHMPTYVCKYKYFFILMCTYTKNFQLVCKTYHLKLTINLEKILSSSINILMFV